MGVDRRKLPRSTKDISAPRTYYRRETRGDLESPSRAGKTVPCANCPTAEVACDVGLGRDSRVESKVIAKLVVVALVWQVLEGQGGAGQGESFMTATRTTGSIGRGSGLR